MAIFFARLNTVLKGFISDFYAPSLHSTKKTQSPKHTPCSLMSVDQRDPSNPSMTPTSRPTATKTATSRSQCLCCPSSFFPKNERNFPYKLDTTVASPVYKTTTFTSSLLHSSTYTSSPFHQKYTLFFPCGAFVSKSFSINQNVSAVSGLRNQKY